MGGFENFRLALVKVEDEKFLGRPLTAGTLLSLSQR